MTEDMFANTKIGDSVIVQQRDVRKVAQITHLTKTMLTADGDRYRRKDGRKVGASPFLCWCKPATPETINAVQLETQLREAQRVSRARVYKVGQALLEAVHRPHRERLALINALSPEFLALLFPKDDVS